MNTIVAYIVSLGLSHEKAYELRSQYYTQYGLTLRGLRRHHGVGSAISCPSPWNDIDSVSRRPLGL
jgi:hypothetical protein